PVNLQQVRVQLFAQNQAAVKAGPVFLQVALPHTAIQSYVPSRTTRLGVSFLRELIGRGAVPVNLIVANGVAVLAHRIARVALYGVDTAILNFLHNAYMVGLPVLAPIVPIKKDDVAGARLIAVVL